MDLNNPFAQSLISEGQRRGYSPYDISAAIGNANVENRLRTDGTPGDNGTAFGGMQWRLDRFTALKSKAAAMGKPWNDPSVQAAHWYDEQDTDGRKGATSIEQANANVIGSLRPGGYTRNGPLENVSNYQNRASGSAAAYAAMNGGAMSPQAAPQDLPAEGAQETQGILTQSAQQPQGYQPTFTDGLDKLSAAFFMRDSPQQAQVIQNGLKDRMANQAAALRRAQGATERWQTGAAFKNADGNWVRPSQSSTGGYKETAVPKGQEPAEDTVETSRQAEAAISKRQPLVQNAKQLEKVIDSISTLREAMQLGTFDVSIDKHGEVLINNLTGNSTDNDRKLKAMTTSIIEAASAFGATQRGALTNFKFQKDMEKVMPSLADKDTKAAYDSLKRVTHEAHLAYDATADGIRNGAKAFPKQLGTVFEGGEDVDASAYYGQRTKDMKAREKAMSEREAEFFAKPKAGRANTKAPSVGFVSRGYKFNGGDPNSESSWTKVD